MNKLNKILGVILTLAILAGSLVMTVPVAAGNDAWTPVASFPVTAGTDTYIYTIAADGTTMYMWTPVKTNVTAASTGTTGTTLKVSNTRGFGPGPILIGGTTTATISAVTSTISLTLTAPVVAAASATVVAGTNAAAGAVYQSTDAGRTWSANNLLPPTLTASGVIANILGIKVCSTDSNSLVAWDASNIYRSVDGSKIWTRLASAVDITGTGTTRIYSVDIIDNGGIEILAGTDKGVGLFSASKGVWKNTYSNTLGTMANTAAYAVAFAPNYSTSQEILGVTVDNSTGIPATYLRTYIMNDPAWDYQVQKATLKKGNTDNITAITGASLAFPSDFNFASSSTNKVYVGIDNSTAGAAGAYTADTYGFGDVYRVNGSAVINPTVAPIAYDLGVDSDIKSVAYSGTASSGTLIVGLTVNSSATFNAAFNGVQGAVVKTSTDADTATVTAPTWIESTKNPYGTLGQANVQLASNGSLYVGTRGDGTAFFKANEATFSSFNGISMFDIYDLHTVSIGGQVGFEATTGTISASKVLAAMQFQKSASGSTELILESNLKIIAGGGGGSGPSPVYNSGGVILLEQTLASSKYLYKSTDGGNSWSYALLPVDADKTVSAVLLVNGNTWWVAYTGYIACNTGVKIAVPASGVTEITSVDSSTNPMNITLKTTVGTTINTLSSGDGGKTWKTVTPIGGFSGTTLLAPKLVGDVYWLVDSYWNVWHETIAGTSVYEKTRLGVGMPIEMKQGADDTVLASPTLGFNIVSGVYFMVTGMNHNGQLWVNTGDTGSDWRPVPGTEYSAAGMKGTFGGGLKITASAATGSAAVKAPAAGGSTTITSITPNSGPTAGGTVVTISGTKLGGSIGTVTFGGEAATGISQSGNPPSYVCTTPPHAAGAVDVVLINSGGTATSAGGFTYGSGPVSAILPGSGRITGDNVWTISAINYVSETPVKAPAPAASSSGGFQYTGALVLNTLWAAPVDGQTLTQNMVYNDTAILAPVASHPAPDEEVNSPVDFTFTSQYSNPDAGYQIQIAKDADFKLIVDDLTGLGQQKIGIDLDPSVTYYWRVRMNGAQGEGRGLMSMWSATNSFGVRPVSNSANSIDKSQYVYPASGEAGVSLNPVMTWGIVNNATYNTQLATDAGFTSIVDTAKDLSIALWKPAKTLEPNQKYFWKVQAVSAGISSDWAVFSFTTGGLPGSAAAPPAPGGGPVSTIAMPTNPVVNVPTAEVNLNVPTGTAQNAGTPPYVWVVILIGAVLVLVVVIMIIRPNGNNKTS